MTNRKMMGAALVLGIVGLAGWMGSQAWAEDAAKPAAAEVKVEVKAAAADAKAAEKEVSLTGKVVDLHCWVTGGTPEGKDPAESTAACLKAGSPAGLDTADGIVVLVVSKPEIKLADSAAKEVTAKGVLHEKGGLKVLFVSSIEAAPAKAEPAK